MAVMLLVHEFSLNLVFVPKLTQQSDSNGGYATSPHLVTSQRQFQQTRLFKSELCLRQGTIHSIIPTFISS
jgi:hypothetical protein